jgi:hypothetical protein
LSGGLKEIWIFPPSDPTLQPCKQQPLTTGGGFKILSEHPERPCLYKTKKIKPVGFAPMGFFFSIPNFASCGRAKKQYVYNN